MDKENNWEMRPFTHKTTSESIEINKFTTLIKLL